MSSFTVLQNYDPVGTFSTEAEAREYMYCCLSTYFVETVLQCYDSTGRLLETITALDHKLKANTQGNCK